MGETWLVDPKTGDYVLEDGKPVVETGLKVPAYIRLKVRRGTWLYAPNVDYGSDYHLVGRRLTTKDNTLVENITSRALQPIIDDGRSSEIDVETVEVARHGSALKVGILDAQGQVERFEFTPIGAR